MSQIALPLVTATSAGTVLTGPSLEPVLALLAGAAEWPYRAAVLAGPPRAGKSLLARWFAASGLGDALDDADSLPEDAVFHRWNTASSGRLSASSSASPRPLAANQRASRLLPARGGPASTAAR